jgi:hypothetical protein
MYRLLIVTAILGLAAGCQCGSRGAACRPACMPAPAPACGAGYESYGPAGAMSTYPTIAPGGTMQVVPGPESYAPIQ